MLRFKYGVLTLYKSQSLNKIIASNLHFKPVKHNACIHSSIWMKFSTMTASTINTKQNVISKSEGEEKKEEIPKQRPSQIFKEKSENNEFFGVPLSKRSPQNETEVQAKLSMPFDNTNQLLQFYEDYRDLFKSKETYMTFFRKLLGHLYNELKDGSHVEKKETRIKYRQRIIKEVVSKDFSTKLFDDKVAVDTYPLVLYTSYFDVWLKFVDIDHTIPKNISNAFVSLLEKSALSIFSNEDPSSNENNYINCVTYLISFKPLGIQFGKACSIMYKLCDNIIAQDKIQYLSPSEIYSIISVFGNIKMNPHLKFMYLVEPHILKNLENFKPNKLANIVNYYSNMSIGSSELIKVLFEHTVNFAEELPISHIVKLLHALTGNFISKEVGIEGSEIALKLIKAGMKKLDKIDPIQLKIMIYSLYRFKIKEKAYYELLAITFSKHYDSYNMHQKVGIIYKITASKIDEASIFNRTQQTLREFLSTFLFNNDFNKNGELDAVRMSLEGIFNKRQMILRNN